MTKPVDLEEYRKKYNLRVHYGREYAYCRHDIRNAELDWNIRRVNCQNCIELYENHANKRIRKRTQQKRKNTIELKEFARMMGWEYQG